MRSLVPPTIAPPFARYAHGVAVPAGARLVVTSGQLGMAPDGTIPQTAEGQATVCFENIDAILADGGMTRANIVRLNAYVTDRVHLPGYMAARDAWMSGLAPVASTLMIVSGFTRPEFVVEIEALAADVAG